MTIAARIHAYTLAPPRVTARPSLLPLPGATNGRRYGPASAPATKIDRERIEQYAAEFSRRSHMRLANYLTTALFDVMGGARTSHARGDLVSIRV